MFDFYSRCSEHTRTVAFSHPKILPTWPDMVRQGHDADIEIQLYRISSENQLSLLAADLSSRVHRWQLTLWHWSAKRPWVHKHDLLVKHHAPAKR